MKQLLVLFLLGLSSCATPSELANRRLATEKFDAVSIGNFVSDDVIREVEEGFVPFVVETIKEQNPGAYRDLERIGELELRGYKRQYYPNPGAEGSFDSPPHEWGGSGPIPEVCAIPGQPVVGAEQAQQHYRVLKNLITSLTSLRSI